MASLPAFAQFVFDCPEHGPEISSLCLNGFLPENRWRWTKILVQEELIEFDQSELDEFLSNSIFPRAVRVD